MPTSSVQALLLKVTSAPWSTIRSGPASAMGDVTSSYSTHRPLMQKLAVSFNVFRSIQQVPL